MNCRSKVHQKTNSAEFGSNRPVQEQNTNPLKDYLASKYLEDFPDNMETQSDHFSVDRSDSDSSTDFDEPINEVYTDPIKIERAAF